MMFYVYTCLERPCTIVLEFIGEELVEDLNWSVAVSIGVFR